PGPRFEGRWPLNARADRPPVPLGPARLDRLRDPAAALARLGLTGQAILIAVVSVTLVLLLTMAGTTIFPHNPTVYLVGAIVMLLLPAFHAWRHRALRPAGPEVLLCAAFYLSMYHAPLMRMVLGTGHFRTVELEVMELGLYAAWAVSLIASLR